MPGGVPVATVALNGAKNAGILAAQIVSTACEETQKEIIAYKQSLAEQVIEKSKRVKSQKV
jgi:5-(carboxyamino)imidazole ribonucleotide mutase